MAPPTLFLPAPHTTRPSHDAAHARAATVEVTCVRPPCDCAAPFSALLHQRMLRRKPTRIELKPDDREEYFQHKSQSLTKEQREEAEKSKTSDKDARIGLTKTR